MHVQRAACDARIAAAAAAAATAVGAAGGRRRRAAMGGCGCAPALRATAAYSERQRGRTALEAAPGGLHNGETQCGEASTDAREPGGAAERELSRGAPSKGKSRTALSRTGE